MRENVSIDVMRDLAKKEIWDMDKLKESELYRILNISYSKHFAGGRVSNHHLAVIVLEIVKDDDIDLKTISKIIDFEQKIRNFAAHKVVSITNNDFVDKVGCSPMELWHYVERLLNKFVIKDEKMEKRVWNSYTNMNEEIIKAL